jgi:hypothetical protein
MHTSLSPPFIDVQCLDTFRTLLAYPQDSLHGRRICGYCVLKLIVRVGSCRTICTRHVLLDHIGLDVSESEYLSTQ